MDWTIARDRWQPHLKTPRRVLPRLGRLARRRTTRSRPNVGAGLAALALRVLAALLERARARPPHAPPARALPPRRARSPAPRRRRVVRCAAGAGRCPTRSSGRFDAGALEAMSRVRAREAAMHVASEALRWVARGRARRERGPRSERLEYRRGSGRPPRPALVGGHGLTIAVPTSSGVPSEGARVEARPERARRSPIVGLGAASPTLPAPELSGRTCGREATPIAEVPPDRWDAADYDDPVEPAPGEDLLARLARWVRALPRSDRKRWRIPPSVRRRWTRGSSGDGRRRRAAPRLRLPRGPSTRAHGGRPRHRHGRRAGLPDLAAGHVPRGRRAVGPASSGAPADVRDAILSRWREVVGRRARPRSPRTRCRASSANIISGRVANVLNLRGPNFIADAACARRSRPLDAAIDLLVEPHFDAVITGGVDRNMGTNRS